ncbi:hypothetical protein COB55_02665 [Candidatus Wolfebacteria bacterium]|nr:MAG: hypothetical protein COB55_02665 [Candidatus Wolfebacteria bacterium]
MFLPWWVTTGVALVALFLIDRFYEVVIFGVLIDILYGAEVSKLFDFTWAFTAFFAVLLIVISYIRKRVLL